MAIRFHNEDIPFDLKEKNRHKRWLLRCIGRHGKAAGSLNFIFTSNALILAMNRDYLNHNDYTDVITFDYSEEEMLSGDIFISVEQVKINAKEYRVSIEEELRRIMIHGVLHLAGFKDSTTVQQEAMREMENEALHLWLKEV